MKPVLVLRHVPHESLGALAPILARSGLSCQYVDWFDDPRPAIGVGDAAGLIVLGGPMNVDETDRYPFLATEVDWLRQALAAEVPILGICLGSQLLAKALGARVVPNTVKEIGWYGIDLAPAAGDDPLFAGCRPVERVFQWHGDRFDLPRGAVHLAGSPQCRQQAFRFGRSAYGLQFHLEVTAEMVESWLDESCNCGELESLDYVDPEQIRRDTPNEMKSLAPLAQRVFSRFALLCGGSRES